jgi:hypothetical protein
MRLTIHGDRIKNSILTAIPGQNRLQWAHPFPPALAQRAKITFPLIFIIHWHSQKTKKSTDTPSRMVFSIGKQ